jgi:type II secretory ATPase GspE/PulE/Tfp pilus assembly ATPase PilB-like protein
MEKDELKDLAGGTETDTELGELLVREELITPEKLETALAIQRQQGGRLAEILRVQGVIKPEDLSAVVSILLNVPFIDLQRHKVQTRAVGLITADFARKHTLIPLDVVGDSLLVVMADPQDSQAINDIRVRAKMKVKVALGIPADIQRAIDINYRSVSEIEKQVLRFAPPVTKEQVRVTSEQADETPIAQTVNLLVTQAVTDRASDIHIEPQEDRLRIRLRIDGVLRDILSLPLSVHTQLLSRIKIVAGMNIAEQRRPQDGQITVRVRDKDIDIRVATMATVHGERATLRILDKSLSLISLSQLGLMADSLAKFQMMARNPFGLVLVGGPTGSGKTTTLYALINTLDRTGRNIMTIEDPVEYRFNDINQNQVNVKADITFASGLRAIMRHDPNVILVGEIRDNETAAVAIQAALTGHLVLSSVHANDAVGVVFRLMNLGIEPYLITSVLLGISTQRMARRLCPHCLAPYEPAPEEFDAYSKEVPECPSVFYGAGSGCNMCGNTGYQGRTGLFEVLVMTDGMRKMIRSNATAVDLKAQALEEGMVTMKRDGMLKVKEGKTSISEVLSKVSTIM